MCGSDPHGSPLQKLELETTCDGAGGTPMLAVLPISLPLTAPHALTSVAPAPDPDRIHLGNG